MNPLPSIQQLNSFTPVNRSAQLRVPIPTGISRTINPRPFSVFRHLRQWRGGGGGGTTPPGDRPLIVVELRRKNQSTRLDEISRLHILFLVLGQHLT